MVNGDRYLLRVFTYITTQSGINRVYFRVTNVTGTPVTEGEVIDAFSSALAPLYKPLISVQAEYVGADIRDVQGTPLPVASASVVGQGMGSDTTALLPGQVSGLISTLTNLSGRQYRGRMYVPFPGLASSNGNIPPAPTAAYVTRLNNLGAELFTPTTINNVAGTGTVTLSPVLHHSQPKGTPPPVIPPDTFITGFRGNSLYATQRRRGNYGRTNPLPIP